MNDEPLSAPLRADNRGLAPRQPDYSRAYYAHLPPSPDPQDTSLETARRYYAAICRCLDIGGWTRGEWGGLRRMERRWRRRVDGEDARWAIVGAKAGRLPKELEASFREAAAPAWVVPLDRGETGEDDDR